MHGAAGSATMWSPPKWERTSRWHWRYWFGYRWCTNDGSVYDPAYIYQTDTQRARQILEEAYGREQSSTNQ